MTDNICVVCGKIIPEGRQICPACIRKSLEEAAEKLAAMYERVPEPLYIKMYPVDNSFPGRYGEPKEANE